MTSNEIFYEQSAPGRLSVIFNDPKYYDESGFRMLESQFGRGFVPCKKSAADGIITIDYMLSQYASLYDLLPYMKPAMFRNVVISLLDKIKIFREIPLLKCENSYLSVDRIFIDTSRYEAYLVYLPLKAEGDEDCLPYFEKKLKDNLVKIYNVYQNVQDPANANLIAQLSGAAAYPPVTPPVTPPVAPPVTPPVTPVYGAGSFVLCSKGATPDIEINKDEFVIGKSQQRADGVVIGSNLVSRVHCKAVIRNGECSIVDLNSLNGTFINGNKLVPGTEYRIADGAVLSVADVQFVFRKR